MKNNTPMNHALWVDCETDDERFRFLLTGRASETGIIAKAIQNEVALAFDYRSKMMGNTMTIPTPNLIETVKRLVEALRKEHIGVLGDLADSLGVEEDDFEDWNKRSFPECPTCQLISQAESDIVAMDVGVTISQDGDGYDPGSCWTCSGCGDARYWEDEGPKEHGHKFCCACGVKIKEFVPYVATPETDELTQREE